ncbi:MAG: acyl--CoA ligase [Clostridia bacterium]|nr:acyl--CoA ligase [Clostridia bacterium]
MSINQNFFSNYTVPEEYAKIRTFKNVTEMWTWSASEFADLVALVDGKNYTYAEVDKDVAAFRAILVDNGVKAGDKVGVFCPNSYDWAKAFLAITTLGAVAVLLPAHLDNMTVFGCSLKFGLSVIAYADALAEKLDILKAKNPAVKCIDAASTCDKSAPAVDVDSSAPCTYIFTGGTTGKSKAAQLSHRAVMAGTRNGCYGIKHTFHQRYFLVLPLTHVFGLIRNLLTTLCSGSSLYICRNTKNMFREIPAFKPTGIVMVPALAEMAMNLSKQFGKNMLGEDLKFIIAGAAHVPQYLIEEYKKFGVDMLAGYGLTESANLVSGNPIPLEKKNSVGYFYPNLEYKIVEGELWLKGENMLDCYVGEPEENATAFEDGWFKTGDLVRVDEDGFLYIVGRKKEIIVLSTGENISPAEIENKFYAIDAIQDCLVYEDNTDGKSLLVLEVLPRAVVVKALGLTDPEAFIREEINKVNAKLPAFQRISKIVFRYEDFKRSPAMKILRNQQR